MGSGNPAAIRKLLQDRHVHRVRLPRTLPPPRWGLGELAGRLVQLSAPFVAPHERPGATAIKASAMLTVTTSLVLEAQRASEPVAWVTGFRRGTFYPPDLAMNGVDLEALVVIRTREGPDALRATDRLLRSGAFGLVILGLERPGTRRAEKSQLSLAAQTRLAGLTQKHDAILLCLTAAHDEDSGSLGSLVSLHATATRHGVGDGRFRSEVRVVKDKRRGPGWIHRQEGYRGPPGLR